MGYMLQTGGYMPQIESKNPENGRKNAAQPANSLYIGPEGPYIGPWAPWGPWAHGSHGSHGPHASHEAHGSGQVFR